MAYFITDEDSTKGRDPNINIINSIHNIKGKTSVNILVSHYTNKHFKFNKGKYIGHLEPTREDSVTDDTHTQDQPNINSTNSVTLQKNDGRTGTTRHLPSTLPQTKAKH